MAKNNRVALALSGGPDSMALLHLSRPDVAFIVDHGLRPESAQEAEIVYSRARDLGIDTRILCWEGAKPRNGIMEAAREARYRLLSQACEEHGCTHLLVAHQQDDQIETYLMRREKGSSWRGLSGIPQSVKRGSVTVIRPLLDVPKKALVQYCEDQNIPYVTDPSNFDPSYTRARIRQEISETLDEEAREKILQEICVNATHRQAELDLHNHLFNKYGTVEQGGSIRFALDAAIEEIASSRQVESDTIESLLSTLISLIGQPETPLHQGKVGTVLHRLQTETTGTASYAGCLIHARPDPRTPDSKKEIWIVREPAAIPPLEIGAGKHNISWDGRLRLEFEVEESEAPATLAPLGIPSQNIAWRHLTDLPDEIENLPGIARASLPTLRYGADVKAILSGKWEPYSQTLAHKFQKDDMFSFNEDLKAFIKAHARSLCPEPTANWRSREQE